MHLVFMEKLGSLQKLKTDLCGFEQCLSAQHESVMTDPPVSKPWTWSYPTALVVCFFSRTL